LISVIIPTCSEKAPLARCLSSLLRQTLDPSGYEILVVNNGGPKHSEVYLQPLLAQFGGRVKLIESGRNLGYGGGCRLGAGQAQGEYLAFHNDDAFCDPCWLALALAEMKRVPDLGAVTCRIVNADGPTVQHEGSTQTLPNALFWQTGYGERDTPIAFRGESEPSCDLDFFGGCIWATPRKVWEEVGGISPAYQPGYYEDTEYGLRCRQLGYRLRLLKTVTCSHLGNVTLGFGTGKFWTAFHRSRYLFLLRNWTGFGWWEITRTELGWWARHWAGHNPLNCLVGFATSLPKLPGALLERRRFRRRVAG
jgi:GT2 family glycosyltransferase